MTKCHRVDSTRISGISGDFRSDLEMESILGMPVPIIHATREKVKKKHVRRPAAPIDLTPPDTPLITDTKFNIELPSRQAAREFATAFNHHLSAHLCGRERQYEQGEATYHYRGIRYLSIYIDYCARQNLYPKRCLWNGDTTITISLSNKKKTSSAVTDEVKTQEEVSTVFTFQADPSQTDEG